MGIFVLCFTVWLFGGWSQWHSHVFTIRFIENVHSWIRLVFYHYAEGRVLSLHCDVTLVDKKSFYNFRWSKRLVAEHCFNQYFQDFFWIWSNWVLIRHDQIFLLRFRWEIQNGKQFFIDEISVRDSKWQRVCAAIFNHMFLVHMV